MILSKKIKKYIKRHSLEESPNECCGLIIDNGNEKFAFKCKNISSKKNIRFRIDPLDYVKGTELGNIIAYYHSHPDNRPENKQFSKSDMLVSRSQRLPLLMYYIKGDEFFIYDHKK